MKPGRVLVTGAAGRIGSTLVAALPGLGWDVVGFDRARPRETALHGGTGAGSPFILGDVTSAADLDRAMRGIDAVAHFAGQATEAPWPVIREANIEATFQLFEAARRAGVGRVVYASSNHAVGFTPVADGLAHGPADGTAARLPADIPPRPDTLYGVSKVFGEALGRYYADRYQMRVACLRIGTFEDRPPDVRSLSTWLSPGDCVRLVDACLRAPQLSYALVWAISSNSRRSWSLEEAQALGYAPRDDAQSWAGEVPAGSSHPSDGFVGGGFTSPGFGIDEVADRYSKGTP